MFFVGEGFNNIKLACLVDCANYFHKKKNVKKAIKYYEKALEIDPNDYYATIGLAGALAANKSFTESLSFFRKAISIKKPDLLTLILLFIAYSATSETDSAKEVLSEIVELFGGDKTAVCERLSYTYFEFGMFKEAECYIKKVLEVYPNNPSPHFNLGNIFLAQGDLKNSREEFQKVLELASGKSDRAYMKYARKEIEKIESKTRGKGPVSQQRKREGGPSLTGDSRKNCIRNRSRKIAN
jgi:tetratricopeptide (TPR) repeat protein